MCRATVEAALRRTSADSTASGGSASVDWRKCLAIRERWCDIMWHVLCGLLFLDLLFAPRPSRQSRQILICLSVPNHILKSRFAGWGAIKCGETSAEASFAARHWACKEINQSPWNHTYHTESAFRKKGLVKIGKAFASQSQPIWWSVVNGRIFMHISAFSYGFIVVTYVWRVYECMTPDFRIGAAGAGRGLPGVDVPILFPFHNSTLLDPCTKDLCKSGKAVPHHFEGVEGYVRYRSGRIVGIWPDLPVPSCTTELVWRTEVTLPSSLRNSNSYSVNWMVEAIRWLGPVGRS